MTRMWMGDPSEMCGNHLLGEHKEIHQLVGSLKRGLGVKGYIRNNCIEIGSIQKRHDELVAEMLKRGWKHESPILSQKEIIQYTKHLTPEEVNYMVDVEASDRDRFGRCIRCRRLRDERTESVEYSAGNAEVDQYSSYPGQRGNSRYS